jgi:uncharacterized membrane protein
MEIKKTLKAAIIGVVLQLFPMILYFLTNINVLSYYDKETGLVHWYMQFLSILQIIGTALLLPFFVTLLKSQK